MWGSRSSSRTGRRSPVDPPSSARLIDHRYSRDAFEALRSAAERQQRARELAEELRAHVATARTPDDGLSSALARLRLIGHHLYEVPVDEAAPQKEQQVARFVGDPSGEEAPTGLELEIVGGAIQARYQKR